MTASPKQQSLIDKPPPEKKLDTGILPSQALRTLVRRKSIVAANDIADDQIQPASLDLRLGRYAYRVRASFLPGRGETVRTKIDHLAMHAVDLRDGAVLEKGCFYVVELQENLDLPHDIYGIANPKSSIGRLDVFTRLITDGAMEFDQIRKGYTGPLFAEVCPLAFSIVVRTGSRLNQVRIKRGTPKSEQALRELHSQLRDSTETETPDYRGGAPVTVDLKGETSGGLIGFKARKHTKIVDVDKRNFYDPIDFWETIFATSEPGIILDPDDFYILASKEPIEVPPNLAAEMVAYDTLVGEFRVHYAGFFDPGFGVSRLGAGGTRAVLEVRSHEVPFLVEDGQIVGRLMYEKLAAVPDKLYGEGIGSSYQRQGLKLGKQFKEVSGI